jgi:hypothetical protein
MRYAASRRVSQETTKGEGRMSVYTIEFPGPNAPSRVQPGIGPFQPNDAKYQLAVIRFEDSGAASDPRELLLAVECVEQARNARNGAVVIVFIHGWHHNAEWEIDTDTGDKHFAAFRQVLKALTLREAERYDATGPKGRCIVGIYVGWNGDPPGSLLPSLGFLTHASFWDRGKTAETIGGGADLRDAMAKIFTATKAPNQDIATESPLILIGHSMGALILESAFLALLKDPAHPLAFDMPAGRTSPRPVEIRRDGMPILFPDVLLALSSAADSAIFRQIRDELVQRRIVKAIRANGPAYAPPLLISATSVADNDTGRIWPLANGPWAGRKTDGHDATLFTHDFALAQEPVRCDPRNIGMDFGQNWHCLRLPENAAGGEPTFTIDLPTRERDGVEDQAVPHARYRLTPRAPNQAHLGWVFQLPGHLVGDHNDIFNSRASSLMLGMIQISGAVMSLAQDWDDTFEPIQA